MTAELKIAITGTFQTGKTLITQTLSIITGMPPVEAAQSFDCVAKYFPGKRLEQLTPDDCFQLDVFYLMELAVHEHNFPGGFWSDGELIQRVATGMMHIHQHYHPEHEKSPFGKVCLGANRMMDSRKMRRLSRIYEGLIKAYSESTYHSIVHFPVEFPIGESKPDNGFNRHRMEYDQRIIDFLEGLALKHYIITGNPAEKVGKILDIYQLKPLMSIEAAIGRAKSNYYAATCKCPGT